jgi:hypothetical protein
MNPVHSVHPISLRYILILSSYLDLSSKMFLPSRFSSQNMVLIFSIAPVDANNK